VAGGDEVGSTVEEDSDEVGSGVEEDSDIAVEVGSGVEEDSDTAVGVVYCVTVTMCVEVGDTHTESAAVNLAKATAKIRNSGICIMNELSVD
jgi:hypothetical protein